MAGFFDTLFSGSEPEYEQISNLTPSQLKIQKERERAAKGGFGQAADYYRGNLGSTPQDYAAFAAPELRQFREQTVPDLAEQFAGMGSGGLSSSGFRNAAVGAGADLGERLGSIRAQLRERAAQGLQGLSEGALNPHTQWQQTQAGSEGLLSQALPGLLTAAGTALGGPPLGALGNFAGNLFKGGFDTQKGSSSPYGTGNQNGFSSSLPGFNPNAR